MTKGKVWLVVLGIVGGILVLGILGFLLKQNLEMKQQMTGDLVEVETGLGDTVQRTSVKGSVIFTALKPQEGNRGEVRIFQRIHGDGDFTDTGLRLELMGDLTFDWPTALSGQNYDVQAGLYIDGERIVASNVTTVTAPATNIVLPLAVHWKDLPSVSVQESELTIGGKVQINGYIPDGAILNLYETDSEDEKTLIHKITEVSKEVAWEWEEALPNQIYTIDAVLTQSNGTVIGEVDTKLVAQVADSHINLLINSTAVAPTPVPTPTPAPTPTPEPVAQPTPTPVATPAPATHGKISGYININGPMDSGTSLLILWRTPGSEGDYNVAQRIHDPQNSGQYWEWDGAEIGKSYEMKVALQVDEHNTSSTPQSKIVSAPAERVDFTINTNFSVDAPNVTPRLDGCSDRDGDKWNANLIIPHQNNIGNYWINVGNNRDNPSNLYNKIVRVAGTNDDYRLTVRVKNNEPNWIRFAVSDCVYCDDVSNFSNWSGVVEFTCFN